MAILTMYDMVLTPKGYRYPFTLRPGSPVWTRDRNVFRTVPFRYRILDVLADSNDWLDLQVVSHWRRWWAPPGGESILVDSGSAKSWTRVFGNNIVVTASGTCRAARLHDGDRLPFVPAVALSDSFTTGQYLNAKAARDALESNLARPVSVPMREIERDALVFDLYRPAGFQLVSSRKCESIRHLASRRDLALIEVDHPVVTGGVSLL